MRQIVTCIGSFGFTGFFPFAPATFSSFIFVLLFLIIPGGEVLAAPFLLVPLLLVSIPVSSAMERWYGHDASCITIDEIVAMQLILIGAETGTVGVICAFFLFRFFDVVKPFPAGRSQRLPGGIGIVTDDIIAALYTRLVLIALSMLVPAVGRFGW
jgi:phosphatidylglycerophosphatase A